MPIPQEAISLGERTVLVAEDEQSLRLAFGRLLAKLKEAREIADFRIFATGEELLTEVRGRGDWERLVVLTDFHLGRVSGVEIAYDLSKLRPLIPLAIVTGSGEREVLEDWAKIAYGARPPRIVAKYEFASNILGMLQGVTAD